RVKAHVDYVGVILHCIINGPHNVGEEACTVRFEGFQRQESRRRSNQVDHTHDHSAVTERDVLTRHSLVGIKDGRRTMVQYGSSGLIDLSCGATRAGWRRA